MSSSTKINYVTRPNKNVERKLIFQLLQKMGQVLDHKNYVYIGFGGFVFSDFVLAHNVLGINSLISMEKEELSKRADFNKPYKCIDVIGKDSSVALLDIDIENKKSVIWLDFDTGITGPVIDDCIYISERAISGTSFFITLNAFENSMFKTNSDRKRSKIDNLRFYAGSDMVPANTKSKDLSPINYPSTLAGIIFTRIDASVKSSSRGVEFIPLVFFSYKDGAQMITVGGIFLNEEDKKLLNVDSILSDLFYANGKEEYVIDIPPLTIKEKICLDSLIPDSMLNAEMVLEALNFDMPESHVEAYKLFYSQYPVFGEVAF